MNRRALFFSVVMGLVSVVLLLLYVRQFEQEMSGGERIKLLTANKPLERGTLVTDDMLSTRDVPLAYVENRAIRATDRPKIVGVRVANAVQPQELLMWTDLAIATEERDLSALVQPGNRAVTVRASNPEETKGNALIRPGDYVDVLATMPETAKGSLSESRAAIVLLQKVLVLAVGLDTEAQAASVGTNTQQTSPGSQRDMVLTLSLNLQEAQLLALASEKGRLSVAVRNPDDQRVVDQVPDMSVAAIFDTKTRAAIQGKKVSNAPTALRAETTSMAR
jgi:pilus assembly protein CpaB